MTSRSLRALAGFVCVLLFASCADPGKPERAVGPGGRVSADIPKLRWMDAPAWPVEPTSLFPKDAFRNALDAAQPVPGGPLLVLEQEGVLWSAPLDGTPPSRVLDLEDRVFSETEAGALGFAARPERGDLYLRYVTKRDDRLFDRLSRFEWDGGAIDPATETVLIEQEHEWHRAGTFAEHFGGGVVFGPDGYLYTSFGDEGWVPDRVNPQKLHKDLYSGVLRIDVDCDPARSHPIPRAPESGSTQSYCIPNDNPFVGEEDALEEFYLIGLRNPFRFSFDRESDRLWIGDAGSDRYEEVNLGVPGGNYQWSYREGHERYHGSFLKGKRPDPLIGRERTPLFAYPHSSGNGCIIGGFVYRGRALPDLAGHYIFGDINSGRIWALLPDGPEHVLRVDQVAQVPPYTLLSFAETSDGELLVVGRPPVGVAKLGPGNVSTTPPPPLSETGLFTDLATLEPAPGVVPYEPLVPSWTDGLHKRHWVAIPGTGSETGGNTRKDRVLYRPAGAWGFPSGTVFVQHLERPDNGPETDTMVPVETRVLVLAYAGGAAAFAYRWNEDGTEAYPAKPGERTTWTRATEDGDATEEAWTHLTASECLTCHHLGVGHVIGLNARQLDHPAASDSGASQLETWRQAETFSSSELQLEHLPPHPPRATVPLAPQSKKEAPLNLRARSYLDANCAFCHGAIGARIDLRREAALNPLIGRPGRHDFGHEGARLLVPGAPEKSLLYLRVASEDPAERMPPLGRNEVDAAGAALLHEWIAKMEPR